MTEREVYFGRNLADDVRIRGEVGGYAPLITVEIRGARHTIIFHISAVAAEELSTMLKAAANALEEARLERT